ncbi:MAG: TIGR03620 family F420-dependent LLM class oxidoreductase [Pseudonocardia sp.]|uniref:TIGR03620 family F420-dependent LLM class oxidoreductase n=1 Tax=unclassified Pseudonocardia TaxID=2619320 RepID=UPI00086A4CB9|nr:MULTISPECIES: TIGR03620 family F420-dependent LLM class oxidoreductase [unclassified Pseudonocardia]MBN9112446.1 TIGR03620 family F420-dependent LLM class oxidoreductase [Pseudonocardia sp.]ODU27286.1 MAG: hypothetical protein ABS80_03855 [Pseudonocardia sp. SCN 72-51]ODV08899.1 MAG: hypothetical protein ABT15_01245 [Pseudonocardia sp. SCN 73-27]
MTVDLVTGARQALGPVGAFLPNIFGQPVPPAGVQVEAVQRLEEAGVRTAWNNEGVGGRDALVQLAVLLASTRRMTFAPAVANMWARPPETAHGGAALLAEAYPGRFVLGLGVGYAMHAELVGGSFDQPLSVARAYLERMDRAPAGMPIPPRTYARILAANGPRMTALAAEIADGAIPTVAPVAHTAWARGVLGPDKLLVVGLTAALDDDPERARALARRFVATTIAPNPWGAANLRRFGFGPEEVAAGSDRVVDAVVAHGGVDAILARVRAHLDAGADHVRLSLVVPDFGTGVDQLERVGPAFAAFAALADVAARPAAAVAVARGDV